MDRKMKRNESNDKKIDYKAKDSGDSRKPYHSEGNMKTVYLERGDSGERKILSTNKKSEEMSQSIDRNKSTNEDPKSKYLTHGTAERDFPRKFYDKENKDLLSNSYSAIRKRIRDKYTFKLNVPVNKSDHLSLYKSNKGGTVILKSDSKIHPITIRVPSVAVETPIKPLLEETSKINEKQIRPSSDQSDIDIKSDIIPENKLEKMPIKSDKTIKRPGWKTNAPKKRKPIIKTVVSKTDTARVFKAVTFVDNINATPLEIKIPGEDIIIKKQQKVSKYTETNPLKFKPKPALPTVRTVKNKPSKETIKMEERPCPNPVPRKRRKIRKLSPDMSVLEPACPPTEVARWVPTSIDPQTKPYYDAWVDTTLAATSKHSKKDKYLYEYQSRLLKSFKRALEERPPSPDLFYAKFADERYAGRIKIRQTDRHGRT